MIGQFGDAAFDRAYDKWRTQSDDDYYAPEIHTSYNDIEGDWPAPWAAWYSGDSENIFYGSSEQQAIDNLEALD